MSPCACDFLLMSLFIYSNIIIMVVDFSSLTYECLFLDIELSTCFSLKFILKSDTY